MNRLFQAVTLLSIVIAVAACNKSEQKPAEATDKAAPATSGEKTKPATNPPGSAPTPAEKATPKAPAAKETAAPKTTAPSKAAPPASAVKTAPPAAATAAGPNSRAIVVAGISSLDAMLGKLKAIADSVGMGMLLGGDPKQRALNQLKEVLEVSDISWFDGARSTRLAVFDPKKYGPNGTALVIPVSDSAKLLASLKSDAKKDQNGHAAVFNLRGVPQYLNVIKGHAVLSPSSEIAKQAAAEFTGPLASWAPRQAIQIFVNMSNVNRLYAQELKDGQRMATQIYGQMAKAQGDDALAELASSNLGSVFDFIASMKSLGLGLDAREGHVLLDMTMQGTEGSSLSKLTKSMSKTSSKLTQTSPANAWISAAGHIDARDMPAMKKMQQVAMTAYMKALQLNDDALVKKVVAAFDAIWDLSEGDAAMSFAADGSFPMAMRYVASVSDAAKVQGHYHEVTRAIVDAFIAKAAGQGTKIPFAKGASLSSIVQAAGAFLEPMGVKVTASSGPLGGATVDALEVQVDWSKLPERASQDPEMQLVKALVGNRVQFAIAYAGNLMAIAMGPNAKSVAPRLATGKEEGGDKALQKASENNAMAMVLHFGKLVKAFEKVSPGLADKRSVIDELVKADPFALSVRAANGVMGVKADVPLATVSQLLRLFSGTKL